MAEKVILLNLMKEHKGNLFSRGNKKRLSVEKKIEAWQEIEGKAKELGLVELDKDWRHIRNITWQNWRKRAIEKAVLAKKHYGTINAKKYLFDQSEKIIFEILGSDSPVSVDTYCASIDSSCDEELVTQLTPFTSTESGMSHSKDSLDDIDILGNENLIKKRKLPMKPTSVLTIKNDVKSDDILTMKRNLISREKELTKQMEIVKGQLSRVRSGNSNNSKGEHTSYDTETNFTSIKDVAPDTNDECKQPGNATNGSKSRKTSDIELTALRKAQLLMEQKLISNQLHMFERERYKMDLEIYKLEKELRVPPSKFTRKFYEHEDSDNDGIGNIKFDFFNEANNQIATNDALRCKLEPDGEWDSLAIDSE